jgi:hypothetical protein
VYDCELTPNVHASGEIGPATIAIVDEPVAPKPAD